MVPIERAARFIRGAMDILLGRVADGTDVPAWCSARGWDGWLAALSDEDLARFEEQGLHAVPGMPRDLAAFLDEVADLTTLAALPFTRVRQPRMHRASEVKQLQVRAFVNTCLAFLRPPARVVDVGSGHGHLTRALADAWDAEALGVEWNPDRVEGARVLTEDARVKFAVVNALEGIPPMRWDDLVVGLHACGALGDALVEAAVRDTVDAALLACCPQKVPGTARRGLHPLVPEIPKDVLGLANVSPRVRGVEESLEVDRAARLARLAVRHLLRLRGVSVTTGEEMRALNRRASRQGVASLAARVCQARNLAPPTERELAKASLQATRAFAWMRRMDLPRASLGRALEVMIALDRAWLLENAGFEVTVGTVMDASVSPRNIMVLASGGG